MHQYTQLSPHFFKCADSLIQMRFFMRRAQLDTNARLILWHYRIEKSNHVYSFFQKLIGKSLTEFCIIHHIKRIVLVGELAYFLERRNKSVHADNAIAHNDPKSLGFRFFELVFQVGHIAVAVTVTLCLAKPYSVDNARMIQLVADDSVL